MTVDEARNEARKAIKVTVQEVLNEYIATRVNLKSNTIQDIAIPLKPIWVIG